MSSIEFTSNMKVDMIDCMGSDHMIAQAARVSTGKVDYDHDYMADSKLINYLVKHRHGSPFEHNSMTFHVEAPIFVFREFMRHRVGWSYNEVSGRYKKLEPKFYVYPDTRPLVQEGSSAHPNIVDGEPVLTKLTNASLVSSYHKAWAEYEVMLDLGVANEVARSVLPVGLFSEMFVTCNARSLMAFLSLRVDSQDAKFETKPQWEIQNVAEQLEFYLADTFPETYCAFVQNGRVAP